METRNAGANGAHMTCGIVLYARDLRRMTAFYAGVTGYEVTETGAKFASIGDGLVLQAIPERIAATFEIADPPDVRANAAVKPVFVVASIAAARSAAPPLGGTVLAPEREWRFHGWTVCDGIDPEGNVVQLREVRSNH